MKFKISSSEIYDRLLSISKVINSKNPLPILDCFLIDVDDHGKLTLTASDGETTLITSQEVIEHDGTLTFAISSRTLLDACKEIPEQPIEFDINPDNLEITINYQNGQFNLIAQDAAQYPTIPTIEPESPTLEMKESTLADCIRSTVFAAGDDELRPVMNGIYFDIHKDDITIAASDGHKLVRYITKEAKGTDNFSFILPKKPANLLRNFATKDDQLVRFSFNDRNVIFEMNEYTLITRLIEGKFPNYNAVIPQNNPYTLLVDRDTIVSVLRRVSIFSSASNGLIKLDLDENQLTVSAQDIDFARSAQEKVSCQYNGTPLSIGFKAMYLIDILSNLESDEVSIHLADPSRAGVFVPSTQKENEEILMLRRPMMMNE